MLNPYEFALRRVNKIINYKATEEEKLEAIVNSISILLTKLQDKKWFYTHPAQNNKFYSTFSDEKLSNVFNFKNPWHQFFFNVVFANSIAEVKKEIYFLENNPGYRDWIVENVRKPKRVLS